MKYSAPRHACIYSHNLNFTLLLITSDQLHIQCISILDFVSVYGNNQLFLLNDVMVVMVATTSMTISIHFLNIF